jgi:hypothetical protein
LRNLITILILLFPLALAAQQKNIPLNREAFVHSAEYLNKDTGTANLLVHTSFKPIVESYQLSLPRSIYNNSGLHTMINAGYRFKLREGGAYPQPTYVTKDPDRFRNYDSRIAGYLLYKMKAESFIWIQPKAPGTGSGEQPLHFNMTIDPLFNLELGKNPDDTSTARLFRNTRGILVRGDIGKKFSFETSFYENQARYTDYITEFIDSFGVAPGQGRVKEFKDSGFDFAMSSGYVSYSPNRHFNFQFGHGKHFVGDGYRSLLLSDNSFNYPYARITSSFGRFQYVNLYTVFMNLTDGGVITPPNTERLFQKKAGAFQMLSWAPHKSIQLGIFQGMIWEASDNKNRHDLNFHYFNPLIGISAIPYGFDSRNNILWGATLKVKATKGIMLYSQFMLDDVAEERLKGSIHNKTGWQAGFHAFNLFTLKNLHLQAEYNSVRPYSYSHRRPEQSYTHYSQPLAHPLGANFNEAVGIVNYRFADFFIQAKVNYAQAGKDTSGQNFGHNIFSSGNFAHYGASSTVNKHLQGLKTTIMHKDASIGYIINPVTNMNIVLGISVRDLENTREKTQVNYYYISFRTSLNNIYYDF